MNRTSENCFSTCVILRPKVPSHLTSISSRISARYAFLTPPNSFAELIVHLGHARFVGIGLPEPFPRRGNRRIFLDDGLPHFPHMLGGLLAINGAVCRSNEVIARIAPVPLLGQYPVCPEQGYAEQHCEYLGGGHDSSAKVGPQGQTSWISFHHYQGRLIQENDVTASVSPAAWPFQALVCADLRQLPSSTSLWPPPPARRRED